MKGHSSNNHAGGHYIKELIDVIWAICSCQSMNIRKLVGQNVRRIRFRKGLTQVELAKLSGYRQQYLSGLERGRRNPTVVTLQRLARAMGVSHVDLVRPNRKP